MNYKGEELNMQDDTTTIGVNMQIETLDNKSFVSDGSHTFGELYHHRAILFAIIMNQNPEISWKSKQHDDGTMYEDYFICGIETKEGSYTYHNHLKYWDMCEVKELERAPKWDGHTSKDIDRLFNL